LPIYIIYTIKATKGLNSDIAPNIRGKICIYSIT